MRIKCIISTYPPCQLVLHSNVSTINWSIIESDMPSALGLVHFLYFPKMSDSRPNLSDLCPWLHHTAHWLRTRVTTKTQISFQFFFQNQALIANSLPNFTRSCVRCPQAWHRFWMTSWQWPSQKRTKCFKKWMLHRMLQSQHTHIQWNSQMIWKLVPNCHALLFCCCFSLQIANPGSLTWS